MWIKEADHEYPLVKLSPTRMSVAADFETGLARLQMIWHRLERLGYKLYFNQKE